MIRLPTSSNRHGVILAIALLVFVIASALAIGLANMHVARHRVQQAHLQHLQAVELARSGLDRGVAQLIRDSEYEGETWKIAGEQLDSDVAATITIAVNPVKDDADSLANISARVTWGEGGQRVQHTRELTVDRNQLPKD